MVDRKIAPVFNREFSFALLQPVSLILPNGIPLHFIKGGEQNVIKIELILPAGRWAETITGASHFTTNLLLKGTRKKTSYEIATLFDGLGAHVDLQAGSDFVSLSIYSLVKRIEPALTLLLEVLTEPSFPEKELQQSKAIYLQNLKVNHEKTSFVASKLIRKNIFGAAHPYGKELEETQVAAVSREDLVQFHANYFKNGIALVTGKLDEKGMKIIEEAISTLQNGPVVSPDHKNAQTKPFSESLRKEGSVQSSIRLGKQSIQRSDSQYPDLLFLNHILGGYFGSRLMKNIREEKGLTYGISSSLQAMKHASYLIIGTDVTKENRNLAIEEIKNELRKLRTKPIPDDELETARNHFIGSIQTELSTAFAHADKVKNLLLYNLDKNFYQKLIARIESVNAEDLLLTAGTHLNEQSFFEVSVG